MFYVFIFDFALVGLLLCAVAFFVWCWIGFRQERKPQPVYLQSASAQGKSTHEETSERYA